MTYSFIVANSVKKTFPLELDGQLHKSLKHKAIECDKTLHEYIIGLLSSNVQEQAPIYGVSTGTEDRKKK